MRRTPLISPVTTRSRVGVGYPASSWRMETLARRRAIELAFRPWATWARMKSRMSMAPAGSRGWPRLRRKLAQSRRSLTSARREFAAAPYHQASNRSRAEGSRVGASSPKRASRPCGASGEGRPLLTGGANGHMRCAVGSSPVADNPPLSRLCGWFGACTGGYGASWAGFSAAGALFQASDKCNYHECRKWHGFWAHE